MTVRDTGLAGQPPHHPGMDRRRFLLTSLAGAIGAPLAVEAQQTAKGLKVGELRPGSGSEERLAALREAGYVEGQNLVVERRHAEGRIERLPALAAELVGLKPDVILATGVDAIRAAKNATKVIPIVMAFVEDPVGNGHCDVSWGPETRVDSGTAIAAPPLLVWW
jgi:putative ABC transport system substrate-binding protein